MSSDEGGVGTISSSVRRARFSRGAAFVDLSLAFADFRPAPLAPRFALFFLGADLLAADLAFKVGRLPERRALPRVRLVFLA
jgi:hypothetical protein